MWVTASVRPDNRALWATAWALFAGANLVVMLLVPGGETIPFHAIWVSMTLLYGYMLWSLRVTVVVLLAVTATTAPALGWAATRQGAGLDEVTEVPLMAAMFAAMVWHARRRQTAIEEVRRLAESELRLRREREFARDASHELRTPITVARGHVELLRSACVDEQSASDAQVVIEELDRLARIADRLLLLAVADHPEFLCRTPTELGPLVRGTARRWEAAAQRRWIIDVRAGGTLLVDAERIGCALDALLENAVHHTTEDDRIAVVARAEGDTAVIEVEDAGEGIPSDHIDRVFDRFSRVGPTRNRAKGGTGLGLPIVKAVVEAHGGSAGVRSRLGTGTTFSIRIPGYTPAEYALSAGPRPGSARDPRYGSGELVYGGRTLEP